MPWKETCRMKERIKFILEWEKRWDEGEGQVNMAALCREFGVSRQCGYKWVQPYQDADFRLEGLEERRLQGPLLDGRRGSCLSADSNGRSHASCSVAKH